MRVLCTLGGILMYALALDLFLVGNNIAAGGFSGLAIILRQYLPVKVGAILFVMNVPLLLTALGMNGWRYTVGSIVGSMLYSLAVDVFSVIPTLSHDPLVAAVFGGAIYGVGMSLLTMGNGSTGGTDLLCRLLIKKFPRMSMGKMSMCIDGAIVVLAMISFRNIEVGLYAIITICVCSFTADRIILGFERGCICMVITAKDAHTLADPLMQKLGRAVTQVTGTGMYSEQSRNMLILAVRPQETPEVKEMLRTIDPDAFVMLLPANELIGGNFNVGILGRHR